MSMILRVVMLAGSLLVGQSNLQAAALLSAAERQEIKIRWHMIFDRQLDALEQSLIFVTDLQERSDMLWLLEQAAIWADRLVNFDDQDLQQALYLMELYEGGPLWQDFLRKHDIETILAYTRELTQLLSEYVAPECSLSFPVSVVDLPEQLEYSGLDEQVFTVKVRRAFLAFTYIVSKMAIIAREQQL